MEQFTLPTPYPVGDVHFYYEKIDGESVLFDCGPPTREAEDFFKNKFPYKEVKYLIFTHIHQDHFGMAYWFSENTDATLLIPELDIVKLESDIPRLKFIKEYMESEGFTKKEVEDLVDIMRILRKHIKTPKRFEVMEKYLEKSSLPIKAVHCPGHSQTDYVYLYKNYAICGDVVLPGIFQTPLLDLDFKTLKGKYDNYTNYCQTIEKIANLSDYKFLPGHNNVVDNPLNVVKEYISKILVRSHVILNLGIEKKARDLLLALDPDAMENPFMAYVKTSNIIFFRTFLKNPELLKKTLQKVNLFKDLKDKWEKLFGK